MYLFLSFQIHIIFVVTESRVLCSNHPTQFICSHFHRWFWQPRLQADAEPRGAPMGPCSAPPRLCRRFFYRYLCYSLSPKQPDNQKSPWWFPIIFVEATESTVAFAASRRRTAEVRHSTTVLLRKSRRWLQWREDQRFSRGPWSRMPTATINGILKIGDFIWLYIDFIWFYMILYDFIICYRDFMVMMWDVVVMLWWFGG